MQFRCCDIDAEGSIFFTPKELLLNTC